MAANLTPQYLKAEEEYRRAPTAEEQVRWLEIMLREMPKHKASEKLQADLKSKLSHTRKEADLEKKTAKKGHSVRIPRQGAGTVVVLGGPNAGKSQLVRSLTRATPEVAPYPFTTHVPTPGMMPWEDVLVQMIDLPPITADYFEPYMQGMIRGADLALLMIDLGADEGIEQCQAVLDKLNGTKTRLGRTTQLDEDDVGLSYTQTFAVPNKIDLPDAADRLQMLPEFLPLDFTEHVISAEYGQGLEDLRNAIYASLNVIRVYTKLPTAKTADYDKPYTLRTGGTVLDVAEMIHKDFAQQFKFAKMWGHGVHDGTVVKGDHVLHDKDVVEMHVG